MRIGLLRLTDAAPVVMAQELGFFADENVDVALSVEPSWANIADKLAHGFLDAAVIVPPLAFAITLGLRGKTSALIVPQALSLGGNTITLASSLARRVADELGGATGTLDHVRALSAVIRRMPEKPVLAVVHTYSTHNLLLRYWLAAGGIDPDKDINLVVVPPAQTVEALATGRIAGFCAGAPWGAVAEAAGVGSTIATSHDVWRNGPEKVFTVRQDWADSADLQKVMRALLRAAQFCDDPANAERIACALSAQNYVGVDATAILRSLPLQGAAGSVFFRHAATYPWHSHAEWFLREMVRWNLAPPDVDIEDVAQRIYRPDLYAKAAATLALSVPRATYKEEGHDGPWLLSADPSPIAMEPDGFCDTA
jgi:NitT/TauT family transport system ATP-binding protein/nitrate/nitrite transport system substrate-binding protein